MLISHWSSDSTPISTRTSSIKTLASHMRFWVRQFITRCNLLGSHHQSRIDMWT